MVVRYDFERLGAEAKAQGLSQAAIARRGKMQQQRVSKFFTGRQQGPETALRIARVLGVDLRDFVVVEQQAVGQ